VKTWKICALASAAVTLAGCVNIAAVPPGPFAAGEHHVTVGRTWSDVTSISPSHGKGTHVLSVNGPLLDTLYISEPLGAGDRLVEGSDKEHPTPAIRADMSATETVEFVSDSVAATGLQKVETSHLRPATFEGGRALRFDITALTAKGLEIAGSAKVATANGKTYVILYLAPKEHYFAASLPEVESIMTSETRSK
jgi:hypothetical protein